MHNMFLRRRSRLERVGRLPGYRWLCGLPDESESFSEYEYDLPRAFDSDLRTVRDVAEMHAEKVHFGEATPVSLRISWSTLGRLVRQPHEQERLLNWPKMLSPLVADTELALPDFDARALATTVNALASLYKAGWNASGALWAGLAKHSTRSVHTMNAHDLVSIAHGFARVGRRPSPLFDAIAEEVAHDFAPKTKPGAAAQVMPRGLRGLRDARRPDARQGTRDFKPQDLANMAWAFAVVDHPAPALFGGDVFVQRCAAERGFIPENLFQLHQWQLWQEEHGAAWPPLPPELAQRCHAAFSEGEGAPSGLQRDVVTSLRALGLAPRERVRTPQGYNVDAVVSHGGREVAVVIEGPSLFQAVYRRNGSHWFKRKPNGAAALRMRQLQMAGWPLLPVPFSEWRELRSVARPRDLAHAKKEYLQRALDRLDPQHSWTNQEY